MNPRTKDEVLKIEAVLEGDDRARTEIVEMLELKIKWWRKGSGKHGVFEMVAKELENVIEVININRKHHHD